MSAPSSTPPPSTSSSSSTPSSPVVRWGILGTGKIARDMANVLNNTPGARLVAIGSRSKESAVKFGTEFGVAADSCHPSYLSLTRDPNVDAVYVATLNQLHRDNMIDCLNGGKHVLCEKPFTVNASEAEEVLRLAAEKKLCVIEAMWTRFFPIMDSMREVISSGTIGVVRLVRADFGLNIPEDRVRRLFDPEFAGGAILDLGCYTISLASSAFGGVAPRKVLAIGELTKDGVDHQCSMAIGYGVGQHAQLGVTLSVRTPTDAVIVGTKGSIKFHADPQWHNCIAFTLSVEGKEDVVITKPHTTIKGWDNFEVKRKSGMIYEALELQKCVSQGLLESPLLRWRETLSIMRTMDSIRAQIGVHYPFEKQRVQSGPSPFAMEDVETPTTSSSSSSSSSSSISNE